MPNEEARTVAIPFSRGVMEGTLGLPRHPRAVVLFAHGTGSNRLSPRNATVASVLRRRGLGTLLVDLMTPAETIGRGSTYEVGLLAARLLVAMDWLAREPSTRGLPVAYFGGSSGAAAAMVAAAQRPHDVSAIVSRGGRADLAGSSLHNVLAPTLLVVGSEDHAVLADNREALEHLPGERSLEVVDGATHLFEEPGALEQVGELAAHWFARYCIFDGAARRAALRQSVSA